MDLRQLLDSHMKGQTRYMVEGDQWDVVAGALDQVRATSLTEYTGAEHDLSQAIEKIAKHDYGDDVDVVRSASSRFLSQALVGYVALEHYLKSSDADTETILGNLPWARQFSYKCLGGDIFVRDVLEVAVNEGVFDKAVDDLLSIPVETAARVREVVAAMETVNDPTDIEDMSGYVDKLRRGMQLNLLTNPQGWARFFNNLVDSIGIPNPELYKIKDPAPQTMRYSRLEDSKSA